MLLASLIIPVLLQFSDLKLLLNTCTFLHSRGVLGVDYQRSSHTFWVAPHAAKKEGAEVRHTPTLQALEGSLAPAR